jgi:hypothetical protein
MIIERFFGKGRAGQPGTQPPQTAAPAQAQKKSSAPNPDEPKPRRTPTPAAGADATARRSEPTKTSASKARASGPALEEPAGSGAKAAALAPPSYEEIAARAYDLWVAQGRPEGRDHENWAEAERQLSAERAR